MREVPQLPCRILAVNRTDLSKYLKLVIIKRSCKLLCGFGRRWDSSGLILFIFAIEGRGYRAMLPSFYDLLEKGLARDGEGKTLSVINEFLQLHV